MAYICILNTEHKILKAQLKNIANLTTGIYAKPDIVADTLYLQATDFLKSGELNQVVRPQVKLSNKYEKHLLRNSDVLFAAKGFNNFGVVYDQSIGAAVASSSFIIIRIMDKYKKTIAPEYLNWFMNYSKQIEGFHKQKAVSTVPSISISQLSELEIYIPDMATQKLIVSIQQLRNKEKEIALELENLKDQLIQELLLKKIKNNEDEN